MERNYNSVAFSPEEVEKGLHMDLIKYLTNYNAARESDDYYEIHITSDGFCMMIEFEKVPYDRRYGGRFEFVDEDEAVMKEYKMSDGSYQWFQSEDEYRECELDFQKMNEEAAHDNMPINYKELATNDIGPINCIYTGKEIWQKFNERNEKDDKEEEQAHALDLGE